LYSFVLTFVIFSTNLLKLSKSVTDVRHEVPVAVTIKVDFWVVLWWQHHKPEVLNMKISYYLNR